MVDNARADAAHLLRRTGFGALPGELDDAVDVGFEATVHRIVAGNPSGRAAARGDTSTNTDLRLDAEAPMVGTTPKQRAEVERQRSEQARILAAWWVDTMACTTTPLLEKRTLFWHNHFATSVHKVGSATLMLRQYQELRRLGGGDFGTLVARMVRDPAMLLWLDGSDNRCGSANENLARELMELFTLGVGNYTDADVREAARALTGLRYDAGTGHTVVDPEYHDRTDKTILGQTAGFADTQLVELLVNQPESARFVISRMWRWFVSPLPPSGATMERLRSAYGRRRDITALLTTILLGPEFRCMSARYSLVKQPVEYVVGILRALRIRVDPGPSPARAAVLSSLVRLGQAPFAPPHVGGWPAGRAWLTASSAKARLDFADWAVGAGDTSTVRLASRRTRVAATARLVGLDSWTPRTHAVLDRVQHDPDALLVLALTSPDYLLN